jgi:excisionase family DNA binding protein
MNLTVKEVASVLRVHDRTVRLYIARGDLSAVRIGRRLLVTSKEVEIFCRLRSVTPTQKSGNHKVSCNATK